MDVREAYILWRFCTLRSLRVCLKVPPLFFSFLPTVRCIPAAPNVGMAKRERERERETCSSANSDISSLTVTDWQLQPSLLDDEGRGKKGNSITFFPSYNVREKSEGRRARNERKSRVRSDRTKRRKGGGKGNSYLCKRDPFLIERDRDGNGRPSPSPRTTTMGG